MLMAAAVGALALGGPATANEVGSDAQRMAALKTLLETRFPDAKIQSVAPSAIAGIYEVISANLIVYSDISGEFVLMGPMIESRTRSNITEERLGEINGIEFATLPLQLAMKTVKGNGSRQMAVFADPLCPYCQQLEKTLEGVSNVTIYTFLMPLESVHPGATKKSREIWCTADPAAAWSAWMLHDQKTAEVAGCAADPLAQIQQFAQSHQMNSTPTVVFGNGVRMAGALAAERLNRMLDAGPRAAVPNGASQARRQD